MAIRNIRKIGDDVLRKKCKEITEITPRDLVLIKDMAETMYEADGVGLAAPQVGILKRLFVIDIRVERNGSAEKVIQLKAVVAELQRGNKRLGGG